MDPKRWLWGVVSAAVSILTAEALRAQTPTSDSGGGPALAAAEQQELAAIAADRARVIQGIVEQWRSQFRPSNPASNDDGGLAEFAAALFSAAPEELLAASRAQSYEEVVALVARQSQRPIIVALEPGQPIPRVLGSTGGDLVFTPITPCRIVDTRIATGGWAGKIGPDSGNWFSVNLANFSPQGGATSCPGMPTSFNPGGVAINLTSTGQTGPGNLRVVACGAGNPLVSLLNYTPGVNLANAAAVSSAVGTCALGPPSGTGPNDIFIRSSVSASDVVVDIMGYYAPPVATAVDNNVLYTEEEVGAGLPYHIYSPPCPAGWRLSGGGYFSSFFSPAPTSSRPAQGMDASLVDGVNLADRWLCQGTAGAGGLVVRCQAVCTRVPGR